MAITAEIVRYNQKPITRENLGKVILAPMWYHRRGLMQTATGYGSKLVTEYKVKHNGRVKRVYCSCFSNTAWYYIISGKEKLTIEFESND